MGDNIVISAGRDGPSVRTLDRGDAETQVVALDIGGRDGEQLLSANNPLPVSITNFPDTQPVSAAQLPLPTGAATAENQDWGNTLLTSIGNLLAGTLGIAGAVTVSNLPATQAISAVALPLPTGAATAANQTATNTSLATIAANTPTVGQKTMAGSSPVVIASDQVVRASLPILAATTILANAVLDARSLTSVEFVPSAANVSVTRSFDGIEYFAHPVTDALGNYGSGTNSGTTGARGFWNVDGGGYLKFSADVLATGSS